MSKTSIVSNDQTEFRFDEDEGTYTWPTARSKNILRPVICSYIDTFAYYSIWCYIQTFMKQHIEFAVLNLLQNWIDQSHETVNHPLQTEKFRCQYEVSTSKLEGSLGT